MLGLVGVSTVILTKVSLTKCVGTLASKIEPENVTNQLLCMVEIIVRGMVLTILIVMVVCVAQVKLLQGVQE